MESEAFEDYVMKAIGSDLRNKVVKSAKKAVLYFSCLFLLLFWAPGSVRAQALVLKGIDVSFWQGKIDWVRVKNAGIDFVMLGCGHVYSSGYRPDPYFEYNIKNANAQGIKVGIYLYSYAMNEAMARREAEIVLDQIEGYKVSMPVAFDIEDPSQQRSLTNAQRTNITKAFLNIIESEGYYPAIYASNSWFTQSMDLSQLTQYDKWVAAWSSTPTIDHTMWQYSSTGRVSGISGAVDLDYCYVNYSGKITPRTLRRSKENTAGWRKVNGVYKYYDEGGTLTKKKFVSIDGHTYYVNSKGIRAAGWKTIKKKTYHFDEITGVMSAGWVSMDGHDYLFDAETGVLQTGFVTLDGKTYYLGTEGYRHSGWVLIDGKKYYLDPDGVLAHGLLKRGKATYYMDETTGEMLRGWRVIGNKRYYFKKTNGKMVTGLRTIKSKQFFFSKDGVLITGWVRMNGKMYYFTQKGGMQKNKKIGKYKLGPDGVCTNWGKK